MEIMKTKSTMLALILNQLQENTDNPKILELVQKGKTILNQMAEEEEKESENGLKGDENMVESQVIEEEEDSIFNKVQ